MVAIVDWSPDIRLLSDVTNAAKAVVTTTVAHGYLTGQYVVINVPDDYQMSIKSFVTKITVLSSTQFETSIDTRADLVFIAPSERPFTDAQVAPASGLFRNVTPGSPA